jgi:beta-lactamase class A
MRPFVPLALLAAPLVLASACASLSAGPPRGSLAAQVDELVQRQGAFVAVAYKNLGTGAFLYRNEDASFHAASTMKVPVMMAYFQAVDAGEMRLGDTLPVRNEFRSIVDGSPYALDPQEDGDADLYGAEGSGKTLEELIRRMITRSSNLATNLLIERIGASRANDLLRNLGAYRMQVMRGVEDDKAFRARLNNTATAKDLSVLLAALVGGETFTPESRAAMIEILKAQEFNEKIPAYLPKGIPIAHKTGDITGVHHDAAIVFPPGEAPYVLVVLTSGFVDEKEADQRIAEISRLVWQGRKEDPGKPLAKEPPVREHGP